MTSTPKGPTRRNISDAEDAADRRRLAIEPPIDLQDVRLVLSRARQSTDPQVQLVLANEGAAAVQRMQQNPDRYGWRAERVAVELGLGVRQVDRLVREGRLTPVHMPLPGNERRFDPEQVRKVRAERQADGKGRESRK